MVEKAEERGGDDRIAEDISPLGEAAIGSQDHGAVHILGPP